MRRLGVLVPVLLMLPATAAAPASAGEVVFSSDRCYEREPDTYTCFDGIWTVRDDGTGLRQLTFPPGDGSASDVGPSWAPDGQSVRFVRRRLDQGAGMFTSTLQALSLATGELRQVGPAAPNADFREYRSADWSPDGGSVVFAADGGLWTMTDVGTDMRRLTDRPDADPRFSPDGRRISFVRHSDEFDEFGNVGPPSLLTMARDGSDVAPVFVGEPPSKHPQILYRVAWSPDGRRLAVAIREDLYTVAAGGGELEWEGKLGPSVSAGAPFAQIAWSSDLGDALIYSRPMELPARPLQRLLLTGPETPPTDLAPPIQPPPGGAQPGGSGRVLVGDRSPDWRSTLPAVPVPPDADPPVLVPVDAGSPGPQVARASGRAALTVRRRSLGFVAVDVGGVRRVEVAIARRTRSRGRPACRFAGRRGLGRARACSRPAWRRVGHAGDLRRLARRLPPARYVMRLRATDALGNRTRRPAAVPLRLRR